MTPFVGNSVEVVSWIVGVFLIALAIGYKIGGSKNNNPKYTLTKNFFIAAIMGGLFLSFQFLEAYFKILSEHFTAYTIMIIYCFIIIAPITYLLGQTIPIMTNYLKGDSVSEISGNVLFLSTIGSFLGAIITTNIVLKFFGVSFTIFFTSLLLLSLNLVINGFKSLKSVYAILGVFMAIIIYWFNVSYEKLSYVATNQYASYEVLRWEKSKTKVFKSNQSNSSILVNNEKYGYIKLIDDILFKQMKIQDKNILVIGAGGFVLSKDIKSNYFTYVDIDPAIKHIAEDYFLREKINGDFVADDGRSFVNTTTKKYDIVMLDAFLSSKSIPEHLSTVEYISKIKKIINPNGMFIVNLIGKRDLNDVYTQNTYKTITHVFPYCYIQSSSYESSVTNIQFLCQNVNDNGRIYTDNYNNSNSDFNNLQE